MDEPDGSDVFECLACQARYRAFYKIFTVPKQGSFFCLKCKTKVHSWQGVRDYFEWERI